MVRQYKLMRVQKDTAQHKIVAKLVQKDVDIAKLKEEKLEKARARLLERIQTGDLSTFHARVAFILNHYKQTRNSDKTLALKYWETFQKSVYSGGSIAPEQFYELEPVPLITRARQKIQNEFKLFIADEKIQRYRRNNEEVQKEIQRAVQPPIPTLTVSCDESGKNNDYTLVGSVWSVNADRSGELRKRIREWRTEKGLKPQDEFHFTEMKKHQMDLYKEFIDLVLSQSDSISFKAIAVKRASSNKRIDEIITDLYTLLMINGLTHEINNGRVGLPKILNVYKDAEDGKDRLTLANQMETLQEKLKVHFEGKVELSLFDAVPSYSSPFVQIADLFTGVVSRKLNTPTGSNQKDELANYMFEQMGIDKETFESNDSDFVHIQIL
jgi:hypothetical protein